MFFLIGLLAHTHPWCHPDCLSYFPGVSPDFGDPQTTTV